MSGSVKSSSKDSLLKKLIRVIHSEIGKKTGRKVNSNSQSSLKKSAGRERKTQPAVKKRPAPKKAAKKKRWAVVVGSSSKQTAAKGTKSASAAKSKSSSSGKFRVYVLQLADGCVYVGKTSRSVQTRLAEHMGTAKSRFPGAAFTRVHPPTGKLLKRLGNLEGEGDGPERDETLRQMYKRGPNKVRGWKYVRPGDLTREDLDDIEHNMREAFDLCRRCGKKGHFTLRCREQRDRHGKAIG